MLPHEDIWGCGSKLHTFLSSSQNEVVDFEIRCSISRESGNRAPGQETECASEPLWKGGEEKNLLPLSDIQTHSRFLIIAYLLCDFKIWTAEYLGVLKCAMLMTSVFNFVNYLS